MSKAILDMEADPLTHRGTQSRSRSGWLFVVAVLLLAVVPAIAQRVTGTITGQVTDPTGAVVPNAAIQVVNDDTQVTTTVTTASDGLFTAPALPPGHYSLIVAQPGFKQLERHGITLTVDQTVNVPLALTVGAVTESVQVTEQQQLVNTETSDNGAVVESREILNLPLNQRDPYSLALLTPGVTGSTSEYFAGLQFNVNGGRKGTTDILLNGVSSTPPNDGVNELTVFPSVDAVEEFKVQTSNFSAEFGASGGGIINVVTKSGASNYHGTAYDFLRNSYMDANNWFADLNNVPLASFKRNQFGGTLGGPIIIPRLYNGKAHTFFFFSYEGLRQHSQNATTSTVPTMAMRGGDFTGLTDAAGDAITIYDPNTTVATVTPQGTTYNRGEFEQHNIIPMDRFNAVSQNVLKYYPLPTSGGSVNNFFASAASDSNTDQEDGRLDEIFNDHHHLSFTFSIRNPYSGAPIYFPAAIAIAQDANANSTNAINGVLDYTYTISPKDLLEVRYGQSSVNYKTIAQGDGFAPNDLGLPSYIQDNAQVLTFPGFEASGYISIGSGSVTYEGPSKWTTNTWMISNTRVFARHTLKVGFETRYETNNTDQYGRSTGDFSFSKSLTQGPIATVGSATTGDGFASFLLGVGTGTVTHNFKNVQTSSRYIATYIQDDWKATDHLTLNLGLRYDLYQPRTERLNRMSWFDLDATSPLAAEAGLPLKGGLVFPGVNGSPHTQSDPQYTNLAPRIGFAFQPIPKLSFRGAWGIFFAASSNEAASTVGQFGYRTDTPYTGTSDNGITQLTISNPFPNGFLPVTGSSAGLLTAVGTGLTTVVRRNPTPYTEQTSADVQYELPGKWLLDVGYVGTLGRQLFYQSTSNQLPDQYLSMGNQLISQVANPFYGLGLATGPLSLPMVQRNYLLTPFPQFTGLAFLYAPGASSSYNSIQLQLLHQFDRQLTVRLAYTGSKFMDDYSSNNGSFGGNGTSQDGNDLSSDYSLSSADVPRNFTGSVVYTLPFGRGERFGSSWNHAVDAILGGWAINGIQTVSSGTPLSLAAANNNNNFGPGERPNWNGTDPKLNGRIEDRYKHYFNTSVFSQPAPYTYGNVTRNLGSIRNPRYVNTDLSLFKEFAFYRELRSQLRLEAFNAFNHPIFGGPGTNLSSTTFGVISSQSNTPRQIQVALKILF